MAGAVSHCGCRDGGRLAIAVFVLRQHQQAGWPPQGLGHRGRRSKNDPEGVAFEYEVLECTTYVVPELTRNADIKLNTRVSLQLIQTGIACRLVAQDLSPSTA
jgi:hypothetical protein